MLAYSNKKGKTVNLQATRHAYAKFIERYSIAFPNSPLLMKDVSNQFENIFKTTNKVKNLNRKEKTRLKRHGDDTMFFRTSVFTFVVKNKQIVTVELSDKNKRHLNKRVA